MTGTTTREAAVPAPTRRAAWAVLAASREGGGRGPAAYARFFNTTKGITEDPATGTAAGPLVGRGQWDRLVVAEGSIRV